MIFNLPASTRLKLFQAYVDLLSLRLCSLLPDLILKCVVTGRLIVARALLLWGYIGGIWSWDEALSSLDKELLVLPFLS